MSSAKYFLQEKVLLPLAVSIDFDTTSIWRFMRFLKMGYPNIIQNSLYVQSWKHMVLGTTILRNMHIWWHMYVLPNTFPSKLPRSRQRLCLAFTAGICIHKPHLLHSLADVIPNFPNWHPCLGRPGCPVVVVQTHRTAEGSSETSGGGTGFPVPRRSVVWCRAFCSKPSATPNKRTLRSKLINFNKLNLATKIIKDPYWQSPGLSLNPRSHVPSRAASGHQGIAVIPTVESEIAI